MAEPWNALSERLAVLVRQLSPHLVRVGGRRRPVSGLVWAEDVVITAAHAVDGEIDVTPDDGTTRAATVVGRDDRLDVAALRVDGGGLAPAPFGDGDPAVGHLVLTLGRRGRGARATLGMIAALGPEFRADGGGRVDRYIEVDGTLPPGFAGGPLVDLHGAVLGLNTPALTRHGGTVPTATLRRVLPGLLAHGAPRRGFLGLGAIPARLPAAAAAAAGRSRALLVVSIAPGGPAEQAGLMLGDVLISLDGVAFDGVDDLLAWLGDDRAGRTVQARLLRAGAVVEAAVVVGDRADHG